MSLQTVLASNVIPLHKKTSSNTSQSPPVKQAEKETVPISGTLYLPENPIESLGVVMALLTRSTENQLARTHIERAIESLERSRTVQSRGVAKRG